MERRTVICKDLTFLDTSDDTDLKYLYCSVNKLTTLDVSNNTALTHLDCSRNKLTSLDVSNNIALTWLLCYENPLLKEVFINKDQVEISKHWIADKKVVFTVKENIKKATSYRLLKDLPNVKAGTIFEWEDQFELFTFESYSYHEHEIIELKDWFELVVYKTQEEMILNIKDIIAKFSYTTWVQFITDKYTITEKK